MTDSVKKRVSLVPLADEHVDQLVRWRAQPEAQQHQPLSSLGEDQLLLYIKNKQSSKFAEIADRDYVLIIWDEELDRGVGWVTLEILSRVHGLARIGYSISKEYWGQGYATAAVKAIARQLFSETPIERIEADVSVRNPASRRVLEKCGFAYLGLKRKYLIIRGERVDHDNFELLKEDWEQ